VARLPRGLLRQSAEPGPSIPRGLLAPGLVAPPTRGQPPMVPLMGPSQGGSSDQAMFNLLQAQTVLLERFQPRGPQDAMTSILGGPDGDGGDAGVRLPGAKGAAAREVFRTLVRQRPLEVAKTIHRNAAGMMEWNPIARPGQSGGSMREYFTQKVAFGNYKTLAYVGFAAATAWDWMTEGGEESKEHVHALLGLLCCAVEQVTIDNGSWTMASQYLCLPEPPWAYISRAQHINTRGPFTELADPRWSAALMGYMRDVDALRSQRKTPHAGDEDGPPPKRNGKGGGREKAPDVPS